MSDDSESSTIKEADLVVMATHVVSAAAATDEADPEPAATVCASTTADDDTTAAAPATTPVEPVRTRCRERPPSQSGTGVGGSVGVVL